MLSSHLKANFREHISSSDTLVVQLPDTIMETGFISVPWMYKHMPSTRIPSKCGMKVNRRVAIQIAVATCLSAAKNSLGDAVLAAQPDETMKTGWKDRIFADEMEKGMVQYEANIGSLKQELFGAIGSSDVILEVGIGTGPNLRFYPKGSKVIAVDPNPYMRQYAADKALENGINLTLKEGVCENLPIEDNSCDFAISTLTLCTVKSPSVAVKEILRVLKPGGSLIFIEHVYAPQSRPLTRLAQDILNPLQVTFANDCHLNRDTAKTLLAAGFSNVNYREFDAHFGMIQDIFNVVRPHIAGIATK